MLTNAIEVVDVWKSFERGKPVLRKICLSVAPGEMVALIGASGSGKSTLIRAIAGLVPADRHAGRPCRVDVFGTPIQKGGRITGEAKRLRARVGVVFQQFNLVPRLPVMTNVLLGLLGQIGVLRGAFGRFTHREKQCAMQALERVGIADQALKRGADLSGGQQQRAAIARTLIQGSDILIADEPIASLDPNAARRIMDILADLNAKDSITVLVSLHQVEYALKYCPRTVALRDGEVVYDGPSEALTPAFLGALYGAESEALFLPAFGGMNADAGRPKTIEKAEPSPRRTARRDARDHAAMAAGA